MKPVELWQLNEQCYKPVYAVLSALRGPDNEADLRIAKHNVTERIRSIVLHEAEIAGSFRFDALTREQLENVREEAARVKCSLGIPGAGHFYAHLGYAVEVTLDHPIWGGLGPELLVLLRRAAINQ